MNTLSTWPSLFARHRQSAHLAGSFQVPAPAPSTLPGTPFGVKRTARRARRSSLAEGILASRQMAESA